MDHSLWCQLWCHTGMMTAVVLAILAVRLLFTKRLSPVLRHGLWVFVPLAICLPTINIPVPVVDDTAVVDNAAVVDDTAKEQPAAFVSPQTAMLQTAVSQTAVSQTAVSQRMDSAVPQDSRLESQQEFTVPLPQAAFVPENMPQQRQWQWPSFSRIVLTVWLGGVALLLTLFACRIVVFRRRLRFAALVTDENTLRILETCKIRLGVRQKVEVYESARLLAPILVGIGSAKIYLPKAGLADDTQERDAQTAHIFLHELAHLRRHDIFSTFATSLFCIMYWFNPLLWVAARLMSDDAEEATDQLALAGSLRRERAEYGDSLLEFAKRFRVKPSPPNYVGLGILPASLRKSNSTCLTRRIEMITENKKWSFFTALFAVGLCVCLCSAMLVRIHYVKAQNDGGKETVKEPGMERSAIPGQEIDQTAPGTATSAPSSPPLSSPQDTASKQVQPVQDKKKVKIHCRVVLPEGASATGIRAMLAGGTWTSSTSGINSDGTFTFELPQNETYVAGVFDTKNRFAAPMKTVTVGGESPAETLEFPMEEGIEYAARFFDKTTGEPVPGLSVYLVQKHDGLDGRPIFFDIPSDKDGYFRARLLPGQHVISIDHRWTLPHEVHHGVYAREFFVKKNDSAISHEFPIPSPFVGKVVLPGGTPARNRPVHIISNQKFTGRNMEDMQPSVFTHTDNEGIFRCVVPPKNVSVKILGFPVFQTEQYLAWFGDELTQKKEYEFRLAKASTVKGRLLDAETKEPLTGQLFFYWGRHSDGDPEKKAFLPEYQQTNAKGEFVISLNPTLKYDLFIVHGRQSRHGGGPYEPRIDMATVGPEQLKDKDAVDLGDILIDPGKAFTPADPGAWWKTLFTELMDKVENGEKKSMLKIFVKEGAKDSIDYILKHQNEEPLASFALYIVPNEKLTEAERKQRVPWFPAGELLIIANDPITASTPEGVLNLSQLRGEQDSKWNVPENDPSRNGDWKKSPGMFNPKIFERFLHDMLPSH